MCGAFRPPPGHDKGTYRVNSLHLKRLVLCLPAPCNHHSTAVAVHAFVFKGGPGFWKSNSGRGGGGATKEAGLGDTYWTQRPSSDFHAGLCTYGWFGIA